MQSAKPRKTKIKAALREQVWLRYAGPTYSTKCATNWCQNIVDVFNFQCGHMKAEANGGATTLENLTPLCSRCNQSMGTMHMDDWNKLGNSQDETSKRKKGIGRYFCNLFTRKVLPNDH